MMIDVGDIVKKVGDTAVISLTVEDQLGARITDDTPYIYIKNLSNGRYYNGITWQTSEFHLYMDHISNGVYIYRWNILSEGIFEVHAISQAYNLDNTQTISVFQQSDAIYPVVITDPHTIQFASAKNATSVIVSILDSYGNYWDGTQFVSTTTELDMLRESISDVIFTYQIQFIETGIYTVFARNQIDVTDQLLYSINVLSNSSEIPPIRIAWDTLVSLDGSDSLLISEDGLPVADVEVSAYDTVTKGLINKAYSSSDGKWEMLLKPGRYTFMFVKGGYESNGFERVVS